MPSPWLAVGALVMEMTNRVGERGVAPAEEVLFHVIGFSAVRPDMGDVEAAVAALVGAGLMSASPAEFTLSPAGKELLQRVRRVRDESRRLARIQEDLAAVPLPIAPAPWTFGEREWASLLRRHMDESRDRLAARNDIADGVMLALDRMDEINAVVRSAPDRRTALGLLTRPPFPFNEVQAQHILDMTVSRQTAEARTALDRESARLAAEIDGLAR